MPRRKLEPIMLPKLDTRSAAEIIADMGKLVDFYIYEIKPFERKLRELAKQIADNISEKALEEKP